MSIQSWSPRRGHRTERVRRDLEPSQRGVGHWGTEEGIDEAERQRHIGGLRLRMTGFDQTVVDRIVALTEGRP